MDGMELRKPNGRIYERNLMDEKWTEWVFGNQMEELRRNMLDEERHRMVFGNQMVEFRRGI